MIPPLTYPTTPAALYDLLQERFGIGGYDDLAHPEPPWFKARMTEIAKLKAQLKARRLTVREVAIAAWWARTTGVQVKYVSDLFKLIPEATRAHDLAFREHNLEQVQAGIEKAIEEALAAGETEWAERLHRADPLIAPSLLDAWRQQ